VTTPLIVLVSTLGERIDPRGRDNPQKFADASTRLFQKYYGNIKDNHGVKEANVLGLFAPLGVPVSALGLTLLPDLDNFGKVRGRHAHLSAKAVQSVLDPETEYKRVTDLV
jgi:hypothetical protein